jgi:hypothetical protein
VTPAGLGWQFEDMIGRFVSGNKIFWDPENRMAVHEGSSDLGEVCSLAFRRDVDICPNKSGSKSVEVITRPREGRT